MDAEILRGRMPITIRKKLMKKIYDPGNHIIIAGYENKYVLSRRPSGLRKTIN